jgi:hypothetical protein
MIKIDNSKVQVVSFSGGRTSAYMVWLIESMRKSGEWTAPVEYIFMDTGAEHPKTYAFLRKCVEYFGIELICLRGDFNQPVGKGSTYKVLDISECDHDMVNGPMAQILNKYGTPTVMGAWCTSRMKEETHDKFCDDVFGAGNYVTWLGIRADEQSRLKIGKRADLRYLAEISDFDKEDVLDFWKEMPFDLEIEEHLGNCVFCIKKSINKIALAARDEPELAAQWIKAIESATDRLNQPTEKEVNDLFPYKYTQQVEKGVMYRNHNSMESIIAKFALHSRDEIYDSIRSMRRKESGGCTESCEAFANQLELL